MSSDSLPRFEPDEWLKRCDVLPYLGEECVAQPVVGPFDACAIVTIRRLLAGQFVLGEAVPTDVFVFSAGEPPDRRCTKVGGIPYLRKGVPWPRGHKDQLLPFMAQFNFQESMDHVGELVDGDVLLIFGDNKYMMDNYHHDLVLLWEQCRADISLIDERDVPIWPTFDAFFGSRWRTANFPATVDSFPEGEVSLGGGRSIGQLNFYNPFTIHGTQISRMPNTYQQFPDPVEAEVFCSLYSVLPSQDEWPYPLLNHADSIAVSHGRSPGTTPRLFEFGQNCYRETLYICRTNAGQIDYFETICCTF